MQQKANIYKGQSKALNEFDAETLKNIKRKQPQHLYRKEGNIATALIPKGTSQNFHKIFALHSF